MLQQAAQRMSLCTSDPRTRKGRRPAAMPRLRRREETERYWLQLPSLEGDLTLSEGALPPLDEPVAAEPGSAPSA